MNDTPLIDRVHICFGIEIELDMEDNMKNTSKISKEVNKILEYVIYNKLQSYIEQILWTPTNPKKIYKYGIDTHRILEDFKSAYESIDRNILYTAINSFNIPYTQLSCLMLYPR